MRRLICLLVVASLSVSLAVNALCSDITPDNGTGSAQPSLSARCFVLTDAATGEVLCGAGENEQREPASLTKIMTALIVAESCGLDGLVVIPECAVGVEGSSVYLSRGEALTVRELLYAVLLESANDASVALACHAGGSIDGFAVMMNKKARELGLDGTHFTNPHGLPEKGHYSTAYDLARLLTSAMKNPVFAEISSTIRHISKATETSRARLFVNHNRLLSTCEGVNGGKTGYTKSGGRCLATYCERNGASLCAVTLDAPSDWSDHAELYAFGFTLYSQIVLQASGVYSLHICGGTETAVTSTVEADAVLTVRKPAAQITRSIYMRRFEYAPVTEGELIGYLVFFCGDDIVYKIPLYADHTVARQRKKFSGLL